MYRLQRHSLEGIRLANPPITLKEIALKAFEPGTKMQPHPVVFCLNSRLISMQENLCGLLYSVGNAKEIQSIRMTDIESQCSHRNPVIEVGDHLLCSCSVRLLQTLLMPKVQSPDKKD